MHEPVIHIDTVRWEISSATVEKARYWQEQVSRFTNSSLPGIVLQSLNNQVDDDVDMVIPRIELELPALQHPGDIALLFEEKWKEAIEEVLLIQMLSKQGVVSQLAEKQLSLAEQFLHYLHTGQLMWYCDKELFDNNVALHSRLITEHPAALSAMLVAAFRQVSSFRRLVTYFTEEQLLALLQKGKLLSPVTEERHKLLDKWIEKYLPGWKKHRYRLLILFTLIKITVEKPSLITSDSKPVFQWWQEVNAERYLTDAERNALVQAAERAIEEMDRGETVLSTSEEKMETMIAEIVAGSSSASIIRDEDTSAPAVKKEETEQRSETGKSYFIENAGIILLYPWCKVWFREEGLLNEQNSFDNPEQQMNAARLLQLIAFGRNDFKEYHLVLNKVLCGYPLESAVYGTVSLAEELLDNADEKIHQVINYWERIGTVSAEGFRNSFLKRNGKLTIEDDHYLLRVERMAWDVLLDTYPHQKSIIKLPWMDKPLYTEW